MSPQRVLVTGSAGFVGQGACRGLIAQGHHVRGFDRHPTPNVSESIVGDLTDAGAVRRAVAGVDAIVHLGAQPDDAPFIASLLGPNVVGLFHVMDAARQAGVGRVVLASSTQVISGLRDEPTPRKADPRTAPTNHYALTKAWAEQMGEMYARCYGMSVLVARIGWSPRPPVPASILGPDSPARYYYLSQDDAGRFFAAAVTAAGIDYAIVYAIGPCEGQPLLDLEAARRLLNYNPRDDWPTGLPITGET